MRTVILEARYGHLTVFAGSPALPPCVSLELFLSRRLDGTTAGRNFALPSDLHHFMEVQDRSAHVADLEGLGDHPRDLPAHEKAFFILCSFFLTEDPSFEASVGDLS